MRDVDSNRPEKPGGIDRLLLPLLSGTLNIKHHHGHAAAMEPPPPKNAAQEIIDGKGSGSKAQGQRRSSFSHIRSPLRALRTLSISSQLSSTSNASSSDSALLGTPAYERKRTTLRKSHAHASEPSPSPSTATSFSYGRQAQELARAHSKASSQDYTDRGSSVSTRPTSPAGSCSQGTSISGDFVGVLKAGALHAESSLLKTKKEFLVLTPASLMKFKSRGAALDQFPQISLSVPSSAVDVGLSPVDSVMSLKDYASSASKQQLGAELQIPLEMVVSAFKDEGTKPCFGVEVWWKDNVDGSTFTSIELDFNLPEERDDWLKQIRLAVKQRARSLLEDRTPSDVEADFAQILAAQSPKHSNNARPEIFPVIPRRPYTRATSSSGNEVKKGWRDKSSFYLALCKNVCMLAQFSKSPTGQRVNPNIVRFGLVTLSKVNAHLGDERFDLIFRLPLDAPKKIELSSRHHRSIISRLFKADTYLKPAWPLWTRREIFFVDGETDHIHLPEGEDYGGFKRTLDAYLEGYHCPPVNWRVNWESARFAPEFQLRPPSKTKYSGHQLLAVFRALRFNDYFKSLNFDRVDFSALSGVYDNSNRLEPTPWLSRTGKRSLTRDEYEVMEHSAVLFQEIVGLLLASESVRQVNFNGVLSSQYVSAVSGASEASSPQNRGCDLVPPIVLLLRSLQSRCKSIYLNNNPMSATDVSEICQTLQNYAGLIRCLGLSRCDLDELAMISVWEAIHEQRSNLETLEFGNNFSRLEASRASQTLHETPKIRHLDLGYCLKGGLDGPLFRPWANSLQSSVWRLEYLDLSGWKANFDTIACLLRYLETEESNGLKQLRLNHCGIDGEIATAIICGVGSGRDMHLHLNGNPLEDRSTDWIDLIEGNEGPNRLHLNMVQFRIEENFNRLLQALTNNSTIEFLSLVGTGSPAGASAKTLTLLSKFLERNTTLQFLDLSGYSGKLEDSHMGWGLSGALGGLKHNSTLRQLRLRNHNIGDAEDMTELCRVLASNQGLVMFDLQGNNFNHHQFSQIVHALDFSHRLISFPLSEADRQYALDDEKRLFLANLHSKKNGSKTKRDGSLKQLSKADEARLSQMLAWLQGHWETETARLREILGRNRENPTNRALEFGDEYLAAWEDDDMPAWLYAKPAARDSAAAAAIAAAGQRRNSAASSLQHQHYRTPSTGSINLLPPGPALQPFTVEYGNNAPRSTSSGGLAAAQQLGAGNRVCSNSGGGTYTIAEEASPFGSSSNSSNYFGVSSADSTTPERSVTPPPQLPQMAQFHSQKGGGDDPAHQQQHQQQQLGMGNTSPSMTPDEYRQLMEDLTVEQW